MSASRSNTSRTGRDKQRYGSQGERLVAGVVPLSADKRYVLVIQSSRRGGWVLPKGGWETDEATASDAAMREAWEEAGISCRVDYDLGQIQEFRTAGQISTEAPKAIYQFYEVTVEKEYEEWPEKYKRTRCWMGYAEAAGWLQARPELLEALNRSTIVR